MNYEEALSKLSKYRQAHVLSGFESLSTIQQTNLLAQIEELDLTVIDVFNTKQTFNRQNIAPSPVLKDTDISNNREVYLNAGLESIRCGELALVLLAGGQGTRLGYDGPKGTYNIGLTRDLYIFECLINSTLDVVRQADTWIHLYIMTSDKNHDETIDFFRRHNFFGYNQHYIHFFRQEMLPSVDFSGKIMKEAPDKICMSPNGNGGWFSSLNKYGYVNDFTLKKIKYINVFAVDNVLQKTADPVFLGAMLKKGYHSAGKVVKKAFPDEKVGTLCTQNGKPHIIEYYELTKEMRDMRDAEGHYAYDYGVILNYIFPVSSLMQLLDKHMPLHMVKKIIPYIDDNGEHVIPSEPNGYKFETLALDMLQYMNDCLPFEVIREHEFAPIKNATGVDSVSTARQLLKKNGVEL